MTNRIRDASKKPEVGRPKTEDRNRHGPSTRGDPYIRGKPPMGIGVSNSNITDLESPPPGTVILSEVEGSLSNEVAVNNMRFPIKLGMTARGKPGSWLQRKSRVLAAKNSVGFFGNFIPNGDCFAHEEMRELDEIRECRNRRKGEENVEYRSLRKSGVRSPKSEESRSDQSQFSERKKSSRSFYFSALKGRQAIARGEALGLNVQTVPIAPRLNIIQGSAVAWGKINDDCIKIKNGFIYFKNEKYPEGKRGQKNNTINKVSITCMRFRVEPGMTKTDKTTRLAVPNRLTHITQPRQLTY